MCALQFVPLSLLLRLYMAVLYNLAMYLTVSTSKQQSQNFSSQSKFVKQTDTNQWEMIDVSLTFRYQLDIHSKVMFEEEGCFLMVWILYILKIYVSMYFSYYLNLHIQRVGLAIDRGQELGRVEYGRISNNIWSLFESIFELFERRFGAYLSAVFGAYLIII